MKKLMLLAAMSLASSAYAQMCEVRMTDNRTGGVITTIRANDYDGTCLEGMKTCRLEIRKRGLLNRADCVRSGQSYPTPTPIPTPRPAPIPTPYPDPYPQPYPQPYPNDYDVRRPLNIGENVLYVNQLYTVAGVSFNGTYSLKSSYNYLTHNIRRDQLSVTTGCNSSVCVGDRVVQVSISQIKVVAGLAYDGSLSLKDENYSFISSGVRQNDLAEMRGCISSRYAQICVGNQVINNYNQYSEVVAVQKDGRLVLRSSYGYLSTNVDPSTLVVTR